MTATAKLLLGLGLIALAVAPARPQAGPPVMRAQPAVDQVDAIAGRFFDQLRSGRVDAAIDVIFASSPLWATRTQERESMKTQLESALRIYGPVRTFEAVGADPIGSLYIRRTYLVQHEHMVTRWDFRFVRTAHGWAVNHVNFSDQAQTWN